MIELAAVVLVFEEIAVIGDGHAEAVAEDQRPRSTAGRAAAPASVAAAAADPTRSERDRLVGEQRVRGVKPRVTKTGTRPVTPLGRSNKRGVEVVLEAKSSRTCFP
jgi:hypothetical protein